MVSMKKLIISTIFSLFSVLVQAEIQIQVEPSQITLGETFQLTLTQKDPKNGDKPDLTSLQQDFVILGTGQQINYSIINGQAQSASQWVVTLRPQKSGILTIPAIKLGFDTSHAITIDVAATRPGQDLQIKSSQQQDVILVAGVNIKKPYVNQQVVYTVKIYNSKHLLNADYQGPQVEDALLIPLGDTKRYQTVQNTINYTVEEQNYAIFPQKSGTIKINSPTLTALIYDNNPQRVKAQDERINLSVQSIPKYYKGNTWLPAKQVTLSEHYEHTNQTISQGSTLTRTVTIEGVAIPAQLLPTLNFDEANAFNVYTEPGVIVFLRANRCLFLINCF